MTATDLRQELAFAIEAAHDAGQRALRLRETGRWEGKTLADVGDQACDGYLQGLIRGRYPADGLLSEETKDSPERLERGRAWIVDPLDGTKEYSQVREDWAVHVAMTVDQECAVGAVALPSQGRVLWGLRTGSNWEAGMRGPGELSRGDSPSPAAPRIAVSRSHTPPWVERFARALGMQMTPAGSVGHKVCMLFTGAADVYVHKVGLKEWDTCAPETVARALGWHVCKLAGDEHRYNQRDPYNHELVVCRPSDKERVLAALASCGALDAD